MKLIKEGEKLNMNYEALFTSVTSDMKLQGFHRTVPALKNQWHRRLRHICSGTHLLSSFGMANSSTNPGCVANLARVNRDQLRIKHEDGNLPATIYVGPGFY